VIARLCRVAAALLLIAAAPATMAHHGTAAVSAIGAEGPGAALDTTSPLPLGQGTVFALVKSEYADFQQRAGFTDQKRFSSFNTLAVGYGITPWLSAFAFQPYNWKSQDGVGTNQGLGGDFYAPDMQTGFNGPSPSFGLVALKQLSTDFTLLLEGNHQTFFKQTYPRPGVAYQFGAPSPSAPA